MQSYSPIFSPLEVLPPPALDDAETAHPPIPARQSLAAETVIQTDTGIHPLKSLVIGQRVLTREGSYQRIAGIIHTHLSQRQLMTHTDFAPIRFDPGALPGMPGHGATLVSPDCPVAWTDTAQGVSHFPAHAFCDGGLIRRVIPEDGVHYIRLSFGQSLEICAGTIWVALSQDDQHAADLPCAVPRLVQEIRVFRPLHD